MTAHTQAKIVVVVNEIQIEAATNVNLSYDTKHKNDQTCIQIILLQIRSILIRIKHHWKNKVIKEKKKQFKALLTTH